MRKDIFKKTYNLPECTADLPQLSLFTLLGFLEDIAIAHAEAMGIGFQNSIATQTFWVLTRQKLTMNHWPQVGLIEIQTWSRPLISISATRDFEIFYNNEKIGDCSTRWMVLDVANRRPARPIFDPEKVFTRGDYVLPYDAEKVPIHSDAEVIKKLKVQPSDLDLNQHVNNTKYGQWLTNLVSERKEYAGFLRGYEVNFISETHLGDDVVLEAKELSTAPFSTAFQGRRLSDQQLLFAAQLTSSI
ncbi:MAG: hypothetical protein H7061_05185 [Bdellovibrionaceae bacterium]|nr:hypothetical protein [Bdellovibrio sp.]